MKINLTTVSLAFVAGCVGGLINGIFLWLFGAAGITHALGVQLAPRFTAVWLYQRLVWGGIWGWLFLFPVPRWSFPARGLLYSLGPWLVANFLFLPLQAHKGVLGLQLGLLTPLFVLFYNAVWGVVAGLWLYVVQGNRDRL